MKNRLLVVLVVIVLCACILSGCSGNADNTIFGEVRIKPSSVKVGNLSFGASQETVLEKEGLTEADVHIWDRGGGQTIIISEKKIVYDEIAPCSSQKTYYFTDDKLTTVSYGIQYRDVPHADAYASAMGVYEKLDGILSDANVEGLESGDFDSLDEVGGSFTKQWRLGKINLGLNMNYQDMSEADFTDMDQFNLSISIAMDRTKMK